MLVKGAGLPFSASDMEQLRPFQRRFVKGATAPGIDTGTLSLPRGNGKSWLAAHLLTRGLTPGDPLHLPGSEYLLCAGSIEQARLCYRFIRADLEPTGEYKFLDSVTRIGITHKPTNTRLRVLSSNGKTSMGIVGCPLLVADEPGSWETIGGQLMNDAIQTALGKPNSPMRVIYIGTLAPARAGWWHDLVKAGSRNSTYVQSLVGDSDRWDKWPEIRRVNPLTNISPEFRKKLLQERDDARGDSRLKARFLSYRLNLPTPDESTVLLTVPDWRATCSREVPEREGRPYVGIDLGAGRSWSTACALWANGRVEALAVAPGVPSLEDQERRDRIPRGTYERLHQDGSLAIAEGLRVQPVGELVRMVQERWGDPLLYVADRFREAELTDHAGHVPVEGRVSQWSSSSSDIRSLRRMALDGPLSIAPDSVDLLTASLGVAVVASDTSGNLRLVKKDRNGTARDDVAQSLVLVCGAHDRYANRKVSGGYIGAF